MSQSASVTSEQQPDWHSPPAPTVPSILESLPDFALADDRCSPHVQQRIDLFLLALEALELGGSERMLVAARDLQLQSLVSNRVVLWRLRCTNPWRRSYARRSLTQAEAKALTLVATRRAKQLTVAIRQLVMVQTQLRDKKLTINSHVRLTQYLDRFSAHFRGRMNPRRAKVAMYLGDRAQLDALALLLLSRLLFLTGTTGAQRLWSSLFDGEIR
ncbi:protein of unknown function (DUF3038) [Rubidibacter lacunae KORDI 51-2]|uniref:DUF3038 domain-containing protein n=1 Tax=Rubidibacter lacunae KORDI 51-2 TaxID=582515 RepID=U5DHI6_9CHRO|nr:DUF3038 domain-containing protein [Rubidibacter lacunae]ERN40049.1 protein of unknown function (DUF3038) [Rubidibacter lacunae KORDI 51-2]